MIPNKNHQWMLLYSSGPQGPPKATHFVQKVLLFQFLVIPFLTYLSTCVYVTLGGRETKNFIMGNDAASLSVYESKPCKFFFLPL